MDNWLQSSMGELLGANLVEMARTGGPGQWPVEAPQMWHTALGPTAAAAWLHRLTGDEQYLDLALQGLDELRVPQRSSLPGRLGQLALGRGRLWSDRAAIEAGSTLGWVLLGLGDRCGVERTTRAERQLAQFHRELRANGNFHYFINGNYQVPLCELAVIWDRLQIADVRPGSQHESVRLLLDPSSLNRRWSGYGWRWIHRPTTDNWTDAAGYFTETPHVDGRLTGPAFDPEYVQLQVDRVVRLWLMSGDERRLRYTNALLNAILPLVDDRTWMLDCRKGSRMSTTVPFFNAGLFAAAVYGGRTDIDTDRVRSQILSCLDVYRKDVRTPDAYRLRGYGSTLLSLLLMSEALDPDQAPPAWWSPRTSARPSPGRNGAQTSRTDFLGDAGADE